MLIKNMERQIFIKNIWDNNDKYITPSPFTY